MRLISSAEIDLYPGSQQERLPGFSPQFPHICSHVLLPDGPAGGCIWHWHKSMELFYVDQGAIIYHTPGGQRLFRAGSGGMVNSNVLHRTQSLENGTTLRLHLFEPELLAGIPGGTVQQRYLAPLVEQPGLELLPLSLEVPQQAAALALLCQSFALDETAFGYELRLQAMLSELWLAFLQQLPPLEPAAPERSSASNKVKQMILFMTAHAAEKLSVADIAAAAYCSERECYRCFRSCLHTTPSEYLQNIRLQMASQLLTRTKLAITDIAQQCGLGSSSYFGAQFRQHFGCSPTVYRKKWQDLDTERHESDSGAAALDATMEP